MISGSVRSQSVLSGLVGSCAVDQDNLSCSVAWQPIRKRCLRHLTFAWVDAVSRDKISASVRHTDGPANVNPI